MTVRCATLADIPTILAIEKQSATAAHWSAGEYQVRVEAGFVLLVESANGIEGFICVRVVAGEWEIENVVVAAGFQRQGVGAELVQEVIQRAQMAGGTAVWLEVRESNLAARALYEKLGLLENGRRRGYYSDPHEDAILYEFQVARGEQRVNT
jgi:ribosomal-protein-alanine acetyltransferase